MIQHNNLWLPGDLHTGLLVYNRFRRDVFHQGIGNDRDESGGKENHTGIDTNLLGQFLNPKMEEEERRKREWLEKELSRVLETNILAHIQRFKEKYYQELMWDQKQTLNNKIEDLQEQEGIRIQHDQEEHMRETKAQIELHKQLEQNKIQIDKLEALLEHLIQSPFFLYLLSNPKAFVTVQDGDALFQLYLQNPYRSMDDWNDKNEEYKQEQEKVQLETALARGPRMYKLYQRDRQQLRSTEAENRENDLRLRIRFEEAAREIIPTVWNMCQEIIDSCFDMVDKQNMLNPLENVYHQILNGLENNQYSWRDAADKKRIYRIIMSELIKMQKAILSVCKR